MPPLFCIAKSKINNRCNIESYFKALEAIATKCV